MSELTHLDERGKARMVDVGRKPRTERRAVAGGHIRLSQDTLTAVLDGTTPKGDVLAAARIAGIMAAKRTPELIPLCHHVALTSVHVELIPDRAANAIEIVATARTVDRTGVEMEALTAVSVAALTLYDMLKSMDKEMVIGGVQLREKSGGRSGDLVRLPVKVVPKQPPESAQMGQRPPSVPPAPVAAVPDTRSESPTPMVPAAAPAPVTRDETATMDEAVDEAAEAAPPAFDPLASSPGMRLTPKIPAPTPAPATNAPEWDAPPALSSSASALLAAIETLDPTADDRLRALLLRNPIRAAYFLGDLEPPYVEHSRWFGVADPSGRDLTAVLMLYTGLSMPAVLTCGAPDAVEALLAGIGPQLPRRFYGHVLAEHRRALSVSYDAPELRPMIRMGLRRDDRVRPAGTDGVELLTHRDTAAIMKLYRHYPDNFFEPAQLDTNLYFGIREGDELVSVAGVHVVTGRSDVGIIGNIVTHTEYRGRGLSTKCVGRLLDELFERVGHVALNVAVDNAPAIACYTKFGFAEHHQFLEGWADRR
jgi:cyclic pyranopterin phosphate synthase